MPSAALTIHLETLLRDAVELIDAHESLRTGRPGRQYGLSSLNRAVLVMCVSAWESYVEELMREAARALRPAAPPLDPWPALNAYVLSQVNTFNTPSQVNVERLVRNCVGLPDVHLAWTWRNSTSAQATSRLATAMTYRHEIAHGVNPRPSINLVYAGSVLEFVRRLAGCTDDAVRNHLVTVHAVAHPWPQ